MNLRQCVNPRGISKLRFDSYEDALKDEHPGFVDAYQCEICNKFHRTIKRDRHGRKLRIPKRVNHTYTIHEKIKKYQFRKYFLCSCGHISKSFVDEDALARRWTEHLIACNEQVTEFKMIPVTPHPVKITN